MSKKMLIDATHPEETRVVVVDGNRVEELDVESASRKQLKGNIYLAKVTRVEPSLQAAFVDYGGNRHGFLAFSEIHPDYYQIPVSDREALVAEEHEAAEKSDDGEEDAEAKAELHPDNKEGPRAVETVGGDDFDESAERRPTKHLRRYKIQEVIKRRQVLLVQVVKEERGNKGAALTTYLSLAGRYCVLMPNTARGGGISRKIPSPKDRKRLKSIVSEIDIPQGIAVIVRTAGADRGKAEIKRDFEYLLKLWDKIRNLTLESTAPALIHEEGSLIKRAIRDVYSKEISHILVDGDEGYRVAKDLMKELIPSHAKKVQLHKEDGVPLFHANKVEHQLDQLSSPEVKLKSGGYIVINPTEALVSIDVNSGRATRERNIEETALHTNLEAAEEIARQLRLRDLAGLIVIDFIDMDYSRNQTAVERKLKDAMRHDRARIQIGRISHFGLLELSRQRLRPSIGETISEPCVYCGGTGVRRSTESTAIHVLRGIEEEGIVGRAGHVTVFVPTAVALYILNNKRAALAEIEGRFHFRATLEGDDTLVPPQFKIERDKSQQRGTGAPVETLIEEDDETEEQEKEERGGKPRRSRHRKRDEDQAETEIEEQTAESSAEAEEEHEEEDGERRQSRRKRGRRGGRRRHRRPEDTQAAAGTEAESSESVDDAGAAEAGGTAGDDMEPVIEPSKPRRRRRRKSARTDAAAPGEVTGEPAPEIVAETAGEAVPLGGPEESPPAPEQPDGAAVNEDPTPLADIEAVIETESEVTAEPESAPEPASEPEPAPEPEPETVPEPEPEPVLAAPTPETMGSEAPQTDVAVVEEAREHGSRRGWWQRLTE
jgi:ribonuclease E